MNQPLKVLTIGHSYVVNSNRSTMERVAEDKNFAITLVAPEFFHGDLRSLSCEPATRDAGYDLVKTPVVMSRRIHVFLYRGLQEIMRREKFDLVHIWEEPYIFSGFQVAKLAKKMGLPYFFITYQNLDKKYPPPFSQMENFVVKNSAAWVTGAELVKKTLVARGYDAGSCHMIPLNLDIGKYTVDKQQARRNLERKFGKIQGRLIGFTGRFEVDKGIDEILIALEMQKEPWTFVGLGKGELREKILLWAQSKGFAERVHLDLVKHSEVQDYLPGFDVLLAPSRTMPNWKEQFGRMIIEAFACKVPVIGSDSGEIPYVIGECGIVVPEKDGQKLGQALTRLLQDEALMAELVEKGYDRVASLYTAESAAQGYKQLYTKLAGRL